MGRLRLWQLQKVPGIGSEVVAAEKGVGASFDALPQLAAEAEGSGGTKGRKGAWGGRSRRRFRRREEGGLGPYGS